MKEKTDNFDNIEDYIEGNLDKNEEIIFLQKLRDDDDFYQDFQLWTNLDDWLEELPAFEIRQALRVEVRAIKVIPFHKKKSFIYSMVSCAVLVLLGFGWYLIEKNRTIPQLLGEIQYAEINASKSGQGMAGGDNSKPSFSNQPFEAIAYAQKDTTYQFSFEPFKIKFRLPKVYKSFGKNLTIIYDYKLDKYTMTLGNQAFNIEESKEWKKLYPPKTVK